MCEIGPLHRTRRRLASGPSRDASRCIFRTVLLTVSRICISAYVCRAAHLSDSRAWCDRRTTAADELTGTITDPGKTDASRQILYYTRN